MDEVINMEEVDYIIQVKINTKVRMERVIVVLEYIVEEEEEMDIMEELAEVMVIKRKQVVEGEVQMIVKLKNA